MPAWFVGEVSNITVRHFILEPGDHIQIKRASLLRKIHNIQYSLLFQKWKDVIKPDMNLNC